MRDTAIALVMMNGTLHSGRIGTIIRDDRGFLGQDVSCTLPREQPCYGGRSCDIGRLHRVLEVRICRARPTHGDHIPIWPILEDGQIPIGNYKYTTYPGDNVEGVTVAGGVYKYKSPANDTWDESKSQNL